MNNLTDIDLMVGETMNMNHIHHGKDPFHFISPTQLPLEEKDVPPTCGLLFRIIKGESTFRIHCVPSQDMKQDLEDFHEGIKDPAQIKGRGGNDESEIKERIKSIHWFETEYFELAQVIADHLGSRRFPLFEDEVGSLIDPGISWWIKDLGNSIKIYFSPPGIERDPSLQKLGPLGDGVIGSMRFKDSLSFFKNIFPISEFSCDENCFSISTVGHGHENFQFFKDMLLRGEESAKFFEVDFKNFDRTLFYFLKEIVGARRFWLKIESLMVERKN